MEPPNSSAPLPEWVRQRELPCPHQSTSCVAHHTPQRGCIQGATSTRRPEGTWSYDLWTVDAVPWPHDTRPGPTGVYSETDWNLMKPAPHRTKAGMRLAGICATFALALGYLALATPAQSASSKGCEGGGFTALGHGPEFSGSVAAPAGRFRVQGKYTQ